MSRATALADWLGRLETVSAQEIVLGLDRVSRVLDRLQFDRPRTVLHVGGTNGKGSSVAMLDALLRGAGYRTGTYTSPHLRRYNERISIDGVPVEDEHIVSAFERIEAARGDTPLTYFEFGTLAALLVFHDHEVDVAVYEVGLGGRLDAVNAIDPDAALITSVALDHQEWLGDSRELIAREKAGIMRAGRPVVYSEADRPESIDACARELDAALIAQGRDFHYATDGATWTWTGRGKTLSELARPGVPGDFQLANAAGVLALLEAAGFDAVLNSNLVSRELAAIRVPGRMQAFTDSNRWRFDVAHNPAAATALATLLAAGSAGGRVAVVGMLDDKDVESIVDALAPHVSEWLAVTADGPRGIPAPELARRIANRLNRHCQIADSIPAAVAEARRLADSGDEILVVGSFSVVGPVQESLGL